MTRRRKLMKPTVGMAAVALAVAAFAGPAVAKTADPSLVKPASVRA